MKTVTFFVLDSSEFDGLVHKYFPERSDYEFVADEEANNDSAYTCMNIGIPMKYKEDTSPDLIEKWRKGEVTNFQAWLERKTVCGIGKFQILEALFRKGVIESGNYLIKVSW